MSKLIILGKMPKSCKECPLMFDNDDGQWCGYERIGKNELHMRVHYYVGDRTKPTWCQLKPLPQKKTIDHLKVTTEVAWWEEGYNACIDEILGGE